MKRMPRDQDRSKQVLVPQCSNYFGPLDEFYYFSHSSFVSAAHTAPFIPPTNLDVCSMLAVGIE
jgi:hypothetical protein